MARREGPTGVEERGISARGLPRNLGDLVAFIAKATEPPSRGTTRAEREQRGVVAAIVPMKRGQMPDRPRGGKELSERGTVGRNDGRELEPYDRLNETRTDSKSCEADAERRADDARASHRH